MIDRVLNAPLIYTIPCFVKQTEDIVKIMKIQLKIMQWSNFTSNLLYANLKIHRKIRNLEEL